MRKENVRKTLRKLSEELFKARKDRDHIVEQENKRIRDLDTAYVIAEETAIISSKALQDGVFTLDALELLTPSGGLNVKLRGDLSDFNELHRILSIYPGSILVLRDYAKLGITLRVLGNDSHRVVEIGTSLKSLVSMQKSLGISIRPINSQLLLGTVIPFVLSVLNSVDARGDEPTSGRPEPPKKAKRRRKKAPIDAADQV